MHLTAEQLMAGAQSLLMDLAWEDCPDYNEGHWGVSHPNEHGGWRYYYDGKQRGVLVESEVISRAYVIATFTILTK